MALISQKKEQAIIDWLSHGLPLVSHPYQAIAEQLELTEQQILAVIQNLQQQQKIKRFGVIVHHRKLGYKANGMVVWDIADNQVERLGQCMGRFDYVTLCYQRPRRLPTWQYNLFTMIHGQSRQAVIENTQKMIKACQLEAVPYQILFSKQCFKQRGAQYQRQIKPKPQNTHEFLNVKVAMP